MKLSIIVLIVLSLVAVTEQKNRLRHRRQTKHKKGKKEIEIKTKVVQQRLQKIQLSGNNNNQQDNLDIELDGSALDKVTNEGYMYIVEDKLVLSEQKSQEKVLCAVGKFSDLIMTKGWDTLNLHLEEACDTQVGYFAIGYLEGLLSYQKIRHLWRNYIGYHHYRITDYNCQADTNQNLKKSLDLMTRIQNKMKEVFKKVEDDVGYQKQMKQLRKLEAQQMGIMKGYNDQAELKGEFKMNLEMIMLINYDGGIDNVREMVEGSNESYLFRRLKKGKNKMKQHLRDFLQYMKKGMRNHCSVLFKLVGEKDIVMSHSTWDSYWAMQRVFKYLSIGEQKKITYSSYPGCISSTDDFFIINGNLVVTETSLDFTLSSEQQNIIFSNDYDYIPEYFKVMTSNHLATSANDWVKYMNTFKSAIYYSQWMVFDLDSFQQVLASENKQPDQARPFLLVLEDGYSQTEQVSLNKDMELLKQRFFSSYNEKLGSAQMKTSPRYTAFANNQKKIDSLESLKTVMSYNTQLMDDEAFPDKTESEQKKAEKEVYESIAPRFDNLLSEDETGMSGAIDIKVTNVEFIRKNTCYAKNGPVLAAGKTVFQWKVPPQGQPKRWNFNWEVMGPNI